jgi:hypothetical protein
VYVLKLVNMSYSVAETFEWSRPFSFCSEHRIVDKEQEESVGYVTVACEW